MDSLDQPGLHAFSCLIISIDARLPVLLDINSLIQFDPWIMIKVHGVSRYQVSSGLTIDFHLDEIIKLWRLISFQFVQFWHVDASTADVVADGGFVKTFLTGLVVQRIFSHLGLKLVCDGSANLVRGVGCGSNIALFLNVWILHRVFLTLTLVSNIDAHVAGIGAIFITKRLVVHKMMVVGALIRGSIDSHRNAGGLIDAIFVQTTNIRNRSCDIYFGNSCLSRLWWWINFVWLNFIFILRISFFLIFLNGSHGLISIRGLSWLIWEFRSPFEVHILFLCRFHLHRVLSTCRTQIKLLLVPCFRL